MKDEEIEGDSGTIRCDDRERLKLLVGERWRRLVDHPPCGLVKNVEQKAVELMGQTGLAPLQDTRIVQIRPLAGQWVELMLATRACPLGGGKPFSFSLGSWQAADGL